MLPRSAVRLSRLLLHRVSAPVQLTCSLRLMPRPELVYYFRQQNEPLQISKYQREQPVDPPRRRKWHSLDSHRKIENEPCHRSCETAGGERDEHEPKRWECSSV